MFRSFRNELLLGGSAIAILAAILFPVFAQAKESAKKANCQSNCKQYSTAWMMYVQDYDSTFPCFSVAAAFKPGAGLEVVQGNCTACHSADYIKTQPRGEKFKKDFWAAEVTKMIKVYGAPIDDADVGQIVDYLTANY